MIMTIKKFSSPKIENLNTQAIDDSKVMTSIWELNFLATFDSKCLEKNQIITKHIHQLNFIL